MQETKTVSEISEATKRKHTLRNPVRKDTDIPGASQELGYLEEGSLEPTVENHAALLADPRLSHTANAGQKARMVTQLQRQYGNAYVQRIIGQIRDDPDRIKKDEDAVKEEIEESGEVVSEIAANKGAGQPMDPNTLLEAQTFFGEDFKDVRIHNDARANQLATKLQTKAFTLRKDIFFAEGVYQPQSDAGSRILGHELTHVSEGRTRNKIGFWGGAVHRELTRAGATSVMPKYGKLINDLIFYCNQMDLRVRRLAGAVWPFLKHKLFGAPVQGEGPEHGEDGNYTTTDAGSAAAENIAEQKKHLDQALQHRKWYNRVLRSKTETTREKLGRLASISKSIAERLGDALHITQDRGSHWEGVKGKGHDDPREKDPKIEYDTDNPSDNRAGYVIALKNTKQVLKEFWARRNEE